MNESNYTPKKPRNMKSGKVPFKSCYEQNAGNFRRANVNASEKLWVIFHSGNRLAVRDTAWIAAIWGILKWVSIGIEKTNLILNHLQAESVCVVEEEYRKDKKTDLEQMIGHNPRLWFNCQSLASVPM